jgi:hypothetical protein
VKSGGAVDPAAGSQRRAGPSHRRPTGRRPDGDRSAPTPRPYGTDCQHEHAERRLRPSAASTQSGQCSIRRRFHPDEGYHCAAVSDSRPSGSSRSWGRSLCCRSGQSGGYHGTRLETLVKCFRSCDDPGWWASFDLSSRHRNAAPAAVLGSLQRCVPLRDHLKRVGIGGDQARENGHSAADLLAGSRKD